MFHSLSTKLAWTIGAFVTFTGTGAGVVSLTKPTVVDALDIVGESVLVVNGEKNCQIIKENNKRDPQCLTNWSLGAGKEQNIFKIRVKEQKAKELSSPGENPEDWIINLANDFIPIDLKIQPETQEKKNCEIKKNKDWRNNWIEAECKISNQPLLSSKGQTKWNK